jgi:hypothetical protein
MGDGEDRGVLLLDGEKAKGCRQVFWMAAQDGQSTEHRSSGHQGGFQLEASNNSC